MCACTSVNVRPWPARHRRAPSRSTTSSECRNSPDRVGRVAELEVQRDAPEQVVAGDQQAALGLEQADVRGRVAGRLVGDPLAEVAWPRRDAVETRSRSGSIGPAMPDPIAAAALGRVAAQRLLGHAALARHLQAPREHRVGVLDHPRHQLVARVHPQLAARPARRSCAAWPQWSECACVQTTQLRVLQAQVAHRRARARGAPIESGWCMPVSNSTKPSPAATAHALQCGTPGHGSGRRRR